MKPKANLFLKSALLASSVLLSFSQVSNAATLFWDGGTVNLAGGGNAASNPAANGTWDSGGGAGIKNWDVAPSGSLRVAWSNSFSDTAWFAGTARTVTVSGTVQVGTLNMATSGYTFNSGTLSFSSGIIEVNNLVTTTFNSALSGSLVYNSTGSTATTANFIGTIAANNTGLTSFELNAGAATNMLGVSNAGSLGPASSTVKLTKGIVGLSAVANTTYNAWPTTFAGGILRLRITGTSTYSGNGTLTANTDFATIAGANLAYSGNIALGTSTLTLAPQAATGAVTISGVISGGGNLQTKNSTPAVADGTGVSSLSNTNTYIGSTTVNTGTLALTGTGSVNSSSGITVSGAGTKFLQNSSVAVSPTVTLTTGTVTGNGTVNTVNVGAGTGGIISNNNGVAGAALTLGSLNLTGAANINLFSNSTSADLIVGTITNDSTASQVVITANNPTGWLNGSTYNLINYTTLGGTGGNNFGHVVNGLSARQSATWIDTGSAIQIEVNGDKPYWVGDTDNKWNTTTVDNWKLVTGGNYTTFLPSDDVVFNDNATAAGPIAVDIDLANVSANLITVDNSTKDYTIDSTGGFWIQSGGLTKSGTASLTLNTANKYTGGTTLNAGTLNLGNATALGASGSLVINGGTIDNTSGAAITTPNYVRTFNGDFTFTGSNNLSLGTGSTSLGSAAGTVRTITTTAGTLTLGGVISDGSTATGITKSGNGNMILSGLSIFSGPTTITAGTLKLGVSGTSAANGALGSNAAGTTVQSGATLDFGGFGTYAESITVSGTGVGGTGALINTGADQINAAQHVTLAADTTFGGSGRWDIRQSTAAPTLDMGGFALTKVGAGRFSLVGVTVSNPANIDVAEGFFSVQTSTLMGGDSTRSITVRNGATLSSFQSTNPVAWSLNLENGSTLLAESSASNTQNIWSGPVALSPGTVTIKADGVMSATGIISGDGSLFKAGASVLFLNNANTYNGVTTINFGSIVAQNPSALGTASTVTVASGGRLELDNLSITDKAITISGDGANFAGALQGRSGSSLWSGNVTVAANATRIGAAAAAVMEVSGVIDSGANLYNVIFRPTDATSTVIVSGANIYPGPTTIFGGVVSVSSINSVVGGTSSSNLGAPTTIADGTIAIGAPAGVTGTLRYTGSGETTDRVVDLAGLTFSSVIDQSGPSGLLKFTSDFTSTSAGSKSLVLQGSTAGLGEIAGAIVDNSPTNKTSVAKGGTGTWTLSGTSTFTGGVQINNGVLAIAKSGGLGVGPKTVSITASVDKLLELDGTSGDITLASNISFLTSGLNGVVRNVAGNNTINGAFSLTSGNGNTKIISNGGSLTLAGNIATVGSAGALRVFDLDGTSTGANTVSGTISNGGGFLTHLAKNGSGSWTLTNANPYTGPTTINGGILSLGASGTISSSASISIAAGAKLNTVAKSSFVLSGTQPVAFGLDATGSGSAGRIEADGLTISSAVVTFNITGTLDDAAYVLASYNSKTGAAFASVTPPSGYAIDYAYNGGTQIALVKSGYSSWIGGFPLLGDITEGGDPDFDGMSNVLEYVLNGNPGASDSSILPTLDASGANFVFEFTRRVESADDTTQVFEHSTDLGVWTPVNITGTPGSGVTFGTPSGGLQTVTVTIAKGTETTLFGRLKVTK